MRTFSQLLVLGLIALIVSPINAQFTQNSDTNNDSVDTFHIQTFSETDLNPDQVYIALTFRYLNNDLIQAHDIVKRRLQWVTNKLTGVQNTDNDLVQNFPQIANDTSTLNITLQSSEIFTSPVYVYGSTSLSSFDLASIAALVQTAQNTVSNIGQDDSISNNNNNNNSNGGFLGNQNNDNQQQNQDQDQNQFNYSQFNQVDQYYIGIATISIKTSIGNLNSLVPWIQNYKQWFVLNKISYQYSDELKNSTYYQLFFDSSQNAWTKAIELTPALGQGIIGVHKIEYSSNLDTLNQQTSLTTVDATTWDKNSPSKLIVYTDIWFKVQNTFTFNQTSIQDFINNWNNTNAGNNNTNNTNNSTTTTSNSTNSSNTNNQTTLPVNNTSNGGV